MSVDNIKFTVQFGETELIDRQMVSIRTGDESADMIIADLENRLNKNADRIERQQRQINALKNLVMEKADELSGCGAHRYGVIDAAQKRIAEIEATGK